MRAHRDVRATDLGRFPSEERLLRWVGGLQNDDGEGEGGRQSVPASRASLLVWTLAILLFAGEPLGGQVVTGRILEGGTRTPIVLASVMLVDTTGAVNGQTVSDHEGYFQISASGPGSYFLTVQALGYQPAADGILDLEDGGFIPVEFFLRPDPIEMDPLLVTADQVERHLEDQGFYERQQSGFGHFLGPERLEETAVLELADHLQRLPGVQKRYVDGFASIFMNSSGLGCGASCGRPEQEGNPPGLCTPQVYVDGVRTGNPDRRQPGARIDHIVDFASVLAVETYTRSSSIPMQYSGLNTCGVILIWTR